MCLLESFITCATLLRLLCASDPSGLSAHAVTVMSLRHLPLAKCMVLDRVRCNAVIQSEPRVSRHPTPCAPTCAEHRRRCKA